MCHAGVVEGKACISDSDNHPATLATVAPLLTAPQHETFSEAFTRLARATEAFRLIVATQLTSPLNEHVTATQEADLAGHQQCCRDVNRALRLLGVGISQQGVDLPVHIRANQLADRPSPRWQLYVLRGNNPCTVATFSTPPKLSLSAIPITRSRSRGRA